MFYYRLGVPVKIIGMAGLRAHDSRRWQNQPHLSVSLAYVRDIFEYLYSRNIGFYRLSGQLAPYLTHPDMPQFHRQIEECATELAAIGDMARDYGIRLSMHPGHYIQLSSPDPIRVQRSQAELIAAASLLDALGAAPDAVVVIHIGGAYGDRQASRRRFVENFNTLKRATRQRLALENDDRQFDLADTFWVHRHTGIPLVLDTLHQRCLNRHGYTITEALALALATWPQTQRPKIHFSSPRTALRHLVRNGETHVQMPLANQHSDFIHPFEFIDLLRDAQAANLRAFDIMLEAKGKDLALLRVREQITKFAPDLTGLVA